MRTLQRWFAHTTLLALVACRHASPVTPPRVNAVAAASVAPQAPPAASFNVLDGLRARGGIHRVIAGIGCAGQSFRLMGRSTVTCPSDANVVTMAFTGGADVATGAWVIPEQSRGAEAHAVQRWPAGVRVIAASAGVYVTGERVIYVLVETTPALDRPAGLRSVLMLSDRGLRAREWQAESALLEVQYRVSERTITDDASLTRAVSAQEDRDPRTGLSGFPYPILSPEPCRFFSRARTPDAFADRLGLARVALFTRYPDGIVVLTETVPRSGFAASPAGTNALRSEIRQGNLSFFCEHPQGSIINGPEGLTFTTEIAPVAPTRLPRRTATQTVPDDGDRALVERELRMRYAGDPRVVAAARLSDQGGTVAVAEVAAAHASVVVVIEQGVTRVFALARALAFGRERDPDGATVRAVRFIDGDGDGCTDVVVESEQAGALAHRGLYLTPSASMASDLTYDLGSAVVLNTASSLDDAIAGLAVIPWRSVTPRAACSLVQAARTLAGLRRVGVPDLRVIDFGEYNAFAWRARFRPLSELTDEALSALTARVPPSSSAEFCSDIECEPDRPVCRHHPDAYWFSWDGPRLRLAAVAMYDGHAGR